MKVKEIYLAKEIANETLNFRLRSRDSRLVSGKGRYVEDMKLPNMLYGSFALNKYAHAKIIDIDVSDALAHPDVVKVLTGKEIVNLMNPLPATSDYSEIGWLWRIPKVYPLAVDKVRFMGEPIAFIVAKDPYSAREAAELIKVRYEILKPVSNALEALQPNAPLLYEEWGDNIQVRTQFNFGDVDLAFNRADDVINVKWSETRVSGFPIEPRRCIANYNGEELTIWMNTQSPTIAQFYIAQALRMPITSVKVMTPDVGGGFGNKLNFWKETVVALSAKILGQPVKWVEDHTEFFLTGPHQRDVYWDGEVAFTNDGKILGVKAKFIVDLGVEGTNRGSAASSIVPAISAVPNAYKLLGLKVDAYGVVTNKSFYCAYRGFGKDKGIKFIERAINLIAQKLGMSPEEVRFKNFIQPHEFPFKSISGYVYDSGNYPQLLKEALQLAKVDEWRKKQEEYREKGRYIGIGISFTVEPAGASIPYSVYSGLEGVRIKLNAAGKIELFTNHTEIGQGSTLTEVMVVSDILGVKMEDVILKGPSSDIAGLGPWSSRGVVYCISAVAKAAKELKARIMKLAAHILRCDPSDIDIKKSIIYSKSNPNRKLTLAELADKAYFRPGPRGFPRDMQKAHEVNLDLMVSWYSPNTAENPTSTYTTFCSSADVAIVEVDVETGEVTILDYVHVHDAGKTINKDIVDGQIIGGILQGIGEALYEELIYDENGNLLTTSYADYLLPTIAEAPKIRIKHIETPSPFTELGTKGIGEAPIIPGKVTIINAVEDALLPFDVAIERATLTPERIVKLIKRQVS